MTKERLFRDIARIASLDFQQRMCVNGTKDCFLLLDDLIDATIHEAWRQITRAGTLSHTEGRAVAAFQGVADEKFKQIPFDRPETTIREIVENDAAMLAIRDAAGHCINAIGRRYDLDDLIENY